MTTPTKRIAINIGGGYVPGLNAVIAGAVLAASELGWEVVGIRDGFEGLLFPERHPGGGLVTLTPETVGRLSSAGGAILGTAARCDPFHVRAINAEHQVEEIDRSDDLLESIRGHDIEAVISVVGSRALSILFKLHRKGLKTVCVPKSVENDMATTALSFGFNSALSFAVDTVDRVRQAAESTRKIAVVEVLGEQAGWLALQAGIAVCADAVLIPEIPYDINTVASKLCKKFQAGSTSALVVVAEGATPRNGDQARTGAPAPDSRKASLSPGATGPAGLHVIERSGDVAETVALQLQRLTHQEAYPLVLGQLIRGGSPTAVDRQLGLGYGAAAVSALSAGQSGVMVSFQPPDLKFVPLAEAINRVRTVPADSVFVQSARSLGISLGEIESDAMSHPVNDQQSLTGTVLNIQHFSIHDGPGMRTTVFLKGCSLRCKWCSNPESILPKPELGYKLSACIGTKECGLCLKECPESAIFTVDADVKVRINWDLCTNCSKCVPVCPPKALFMFGEAMTVDQVMAEVEQDSAFYRESGGGITLSGGECLLQADFAAALLAEAHRRGINTAIETAGNVPWPFMEKVLQHVDLVQHDLKVTDPERHTEMDGRGQQTIPR